MRSKAAIEDDINFYKAAREELRKAYIELIDGRAQQYTIGNRQLTRLDLKTLSKEIEDKDAKIASLESELNGAKKMRAVAAVPMNW